MIVVGSVLYDSDGQCTVQSLVVLTVTCVFHLMLPMLWGVNATLLSLYTVLCVCIERIFLSLLQNLAGPTPVTCGVLVVSCLSSTEASHCSRHTITASTWE